MVHAPPLYIQERCIPRRSWTTSCVRLRASERPALAASNLASSICSLTSTDDVDGKQYQPNGIEASRV